MAELELEEEPSEDKAGGERTESDDDVLPILDSGVSPNWNPGEKIINWFKKVADIELKDD